MSDAPSFMPDHDIVELLWENGPIVMQGQSNRQQKSSNPTPFPSHNLRVQEKDGRDPTMQKFGQFEAIHSTVNELSPAVPCANIGLNTQDDDMTPWMNYPIEDPICSEFFSELAGINPNPRPTERNNGVAKDFHNVENGNTSKALREGSEPSKFKTNHLFQSSVVNNIRPKLVDSSTRQGQSQKQDLVSSPKPLYSSSGFGLMNFSHFSRPASLARANNESLDRLKAKEKVSLTSASTNQMESTLIQCSETLHTVEMKSVAKTKADVEGIFHDDASKNNHHNNSVATNNTPSGHKINNQISSFAASVAVGKNDTEKGPEPIVVSSSVCSGNSAGAASNDPKHRAKRKNREGEESGFHSEDLNVESTGLKKPTSARGGTSTKRSRAAEVHNLSERRRRDRINEKMWALQELIPNCNKVDKASMLDEAIEYLKTLQLQVQMMSMGSGLCMPPMMLQPGTQHMCTPPMAHFPPMNVGMGIGMGLGYGMGMLDMNGIPIPSMHTSQFPCPLIPGSTVLPLFGIPGHMHGHGQGLPMPLPHAPLFNPLSNLTPKGNSMIEVSGTIATPLPASDVGPSSRCMNLEAKQNGSNSESQAQFAQMGNQTSHANNGNAAASAISDTGTGSSG